MTYAEIEAEAEADAKNAPVGDSLKSLKKEDLVAKAEELGIELDGSEKKDDLIALIEDAQAE